MRIFKYTVLLSLAALATSCQEILTGDQSYRFAASVVYDLYTTSLQPPLVDVSTMHKASSWLDNIDDESARQEIEDLYFSKIAPRTKDDVITIITSTNGDEISIQHNSISIVEEGAQWSISADSSTSTKKITINNIDGKQWLCTQEEPNGDILLRFTIEWSDIDNYTFTLEGDSTIIYANSPITGQHFASTSILAAKTLSAPPYPIESYLSIIDGSLTVELLDEGSQVIESDNIDVTFQEDVIVSPYYNYSDYSCSYTFNPLILFRGNRFYYNDVYSLFYYQ